jgi:hypothetical protein
MVFEQRVLYRPKAFFVRLIPKLRCNRQWPHLISTRKQPRTFAACLLNWAKSMRAQPLPYHPDLRSHQIQAGVSEKSERKRPQLFSVSGISRGSDLATGSNTHSARLHQVRLTSGKVSP